MRFCRPLPSNLRKSLYCVFYLLAALLTVQSAADDTSPIAWQTKQSAWQSRTKQSFVSAEPRSVQSAAASPEPRSVQSVDTAAWQSAAGPTAWQTKQSFVHLCSNTIGYNVRLRSTTIVTVT